MNSKLLAIIAFVSTIALFLVIWWLHGWSLD